MEKIHVLFIRSDSDESSPADHYTAVKLAAEPDVVLHEARFHADDDIDLERKLEERAPEVRGVVGAMHVPRAQRLGEIAERLNLLCFVGNNNPVVWQNRRHVFHIGLPTPQTTAGVTAELLRKPGLHRFLLLHDDNEFQTRVATTMQATLAARGKEAKAWTPPPDGRLEMPPGWKPDVIYVVFSSRQKALRLVTALQETAPGVPLVLGRSLLREVFLKSVAGMPGEFWFVDTAFRRPGLRTQSQEEFVNTLTNHGVPIPTTSHAFGWDTMRFCAAALRGGGGDPLKAIDYLESGVPLEGASGSCRFSPGNHNGRLGEGPTILSRWHAGRLSAI